MKIKKRKLSLIVCTLLVVQFMIVIENSEIKAAREEGNYDPVLSSLKPIDNITINSDSDFITYGFPGYGNESHPYLIDEYNVTSSDQRGIYVRQTTAYFIIQNCYVNADNDGISFSYVEANTATIRNNTIVHNSNRAIQLMWTEGCLIEENTFFDNSQALYTREAHNTIFRDNIISECTSERPVFIFNSQYCVIDNNEINGNEYDDCIGLRLAFNTNITNNRVYNGGMYIEEYDSESFLLYSFENNYVNDKPLGFFRNLQSLTLNQDYYGQILIFNCTNVEISYQDIGNTNYAVKIAGSNYVEVHDCSFTENEEGMDIQTSNYTHIYNNLFSDNKIGLDLEDTWFIDIENNDFINTENTCVGISPSESDYMEYSIVRGNNFLHCKTGVNLYTQHYAKVIDNLFLNNSIKGIYITESENATIEGNDFYDNAIAIDAQDDINCTVISNNFYENYETGVYFQNVYNSTIKYNIFVSNSEIVDDQNYAVFLDFNAEGNSVHHNIFYNNSISHSSQARNEGANNTWYDMATLEGNYWYDWTGIGSYYIYSEGAPVFDYYPLNDTDNDRIDDIEEIFDYYTDPFDEDSDDDLLTDGAEIIDYETDPTSEDSDGDGLTDGEEVINHNTDPLSRDTDGDSLDDYWEVTYGTDPFSNDTAEDPDKDKLTNLQEFFYGTDPFNEDSDSDGHSDGKEVKKGTDPLNASDYPAFPVGALVGGLVGSTVVLGGVTFAVFYMRKEEILFFKKS